MSDLLAEVAPGLTSGRPAAKAIVTGGVTFAVGLPAAYIALLTGERKQHAGGISTYPVPALTEVRMIVGTAALPAGAADWLLRVTPAAGFAIQQGYPRYPQLDAGYTPANGYFPLAPWAGFALLACSPSWARWSATRPGTGTSRN